MAKVTQKLTPVTIKAKAKPGAKPFKLADGQGLYLLIKPNGACYWRMAYRFGSLQKLLALGVYPELSLADARRAAETARASLASGIDPSAIRKEAKAAVIAAEVIEVTRTERTFQAVAVDWLSKQEAKLTNATMKKTRWMLDSFAYPAIGARAVESLEAPDMLAILRTLEARGVLVTAHRLSQYFSMIFRYAIACGYITRNPAADLRGALTAAITTNRAAITEPAKIGALLRAIDGFEGHFVTQIALRLAPLVFVRPGELRNAQWSEFDLDAALWRIDAKRMKMRAPHDVPLSRQALAILAELKPVTGSGALLFPGVRVYERAISENTLNAALRRLGFTATEMTAHGFRAMASTRLNEMHLFAPDVIERQLAHREANKVRAAYDRSQHWAERIKMMQVWADYLDTLRTGGNVIAGKFGRAA